MIRKTLPAAIFISLAVSIALNLYQLNNNAASTQISEQLRHDSENLKHIIYDLEDEMAYCRSELEKCSDAQFHTNKESSYNSKNP
ncbi:MAG TPA: hypothetical protein VFQ50_11065 [Flavobacterium sp.]|jgi:hypothetical protein|nr:hypothetical protein [Flavobacterium sp.]